MENLKNHLLQLNREIEILEKRIKLRDKQIDELELDKKRLQKQVEEMIANACDFNNL